MEKFIVSKQAMRPASDEEECFYCNIAIGGHHKDTCVLVSKKVKVKLTVEYEVEVPSFWNKDNIEFHRNESSWCADNAMDELIEVFDIDNEESCMCGHLNFEYVGGDTEPYLDEK